MLAKLASPLPRSRRGRLAPGSVRHSLHRDYWIDYSADFHHGISRSDKIAMFGISQYDNVRLRPDMAAYLGNLHLLRALAKIEDLRITQTAPTKSNL
ncbi:hypothetical protein [Duncaniella muris]|uniref:hypothetical protein n=1 Tax=Duncaniella muris TaxID=2094150 RepID=UPI003F676BC8